MAVHNSVVSRYPTLVHGVSATSRYVVSTLLEKGADVAFKAYDENVASVYQMIPAEDFYIDRDVVVYGSALPEFIHERYPAPLLVPASPSDRAKLRMATAEVTSWYGLSTADLITKIEEAAEAYSGAAHYLSTNISTIDLALAPLIEALVEEGFPDTHEMFNKHLEFKRYAKRLLVRDSVVSSRRLCV